MLLTILAEECNEVAQRCTKAIRFGLAEVQPMQGYSNAQRILHEYADLVGTLDMLREEDSIPNWGVIDEFVDRVEAKKAKIEKYLEYSRQCKTLSE